MQRLIIPLSLAFVTAATATAWAAVSSDDASFVQSAQHEALGEYAIAALARGNAQNPDVKALAAQVASNSAQANDFIRSYAKKNGVDVDNKPSVRADNQYGNIQGEKGSAFDKDFANALHLDAEMAQSDYQDEIARGSDPALKAFAKQQLQALQRIASEADKIAAH